MHKILKGQNGTSVPNLVSKLPEVKLPDISTIMPKINSLNTSDIGLAQASKIGSTKAASKSGKSGSGSGGVNNMSEGLQAGLNFIGSTLGALSGGHLTQEQSMTREGIRGAIGSFGPVGAIVNAASGVVDALGAATGLNLDNLDRSAAKRAGVKGAAGANQIINSLPAMSMLVGMFGGRTAKSYKSAEIDQLTSAYGGSVGDINAAQKLSNKRTLFGKGKINKFIKKQNKINNLLTDIGLDAKLAKSNTAAETYISQNQNQYSGYTPQLLLSRKGMKFPQLDDARKLISSWSIKSTETQELRKFKLGGSMNLIPEGVLHARKHQLENINPNLKDQITNKGIPVITESDGEIVQTAEIEKDEWTLRKEFTDKLEELYKLYQKDPSDEVAIKAGKLICYELLKNTDDRSGLIKSIK